LGETIKIAILSYKPITKPYDGYGQAIVNEARLLQRLNNDVAIFSIGKKEEIVIVPEGIRQYIVKGYTLRESGLGITRLLDFIILFLFGVRPSIYFLNKNRRLQAQIINFKPTVLILPSTYMVDLAIQCIKNSRNSSVITYTDAFDTIVSSFNTIYFLKIPRFIKPILKIFYKKYKAHVYLLYKRLLNISEIIVVPTKQDKISIIREFSREVAGKSIFIIPPVIMKQNTQKHNKNEVRHINTITFIGTARYFPNEGAVSIIKTKIAPKLPKIKFLIVGKGWKKEKNKNIEIIGEVDDLNTVFDKTDAFIAPITSGAGMKTKIATYLEAGKPIIGTSVAFEGYGIKDKVDGIVEDNLESIYKRIGDLNENPRKILTIQKNMRKILIKFSEEAIVRKWKKVINKIE
jgi:hypothetical protein